MADPFLPLGAAASGRGPDRAAQIVAEARRWIGTPYRHQGTLCGAGTDCLGLIRGIWRSVIGPEPFALPAYTSDWAEPDGDEPLLRAAELCLLRRADQTMAAGDVLLFRMREGSVAKHLGIVSACQPVPRFIHAYAGHGVVENALSAPWARRVAAVFRFPDEVI